MSHIALVLFVVGFAVIVAMGDKAGKNFTMPQKKGVKPSLKSSSGKEGFNFSPFITFTA